MSNLLTLSISVLVGEDQNEVAAATNLLNWQFWAGIVDQLRIDAIVKQAKANAEDTDKEDE